LSACALRSSSEKDHRAADAQAEERSMATTIPNGNFISSPAAHTSRSRQRAQTSVYRPRKLSQEAGRGIEILAHAIEYLADQFSLECMNAGVKGNCVAQPEMVAIELMMELNRQIYFSCPEVPPLSERLRNKFRGIFGAHAS